MDTGDPAKIASAISELLADPAALAERGRLARVAAMERYNWRVTEKAFLDVYARL